MNAWKFSPINSCVVAIVDADGDSIFDMSAGLNTVGQSQLLDNAALVCAAPALLAALEHCARVLSDLPSTNQGGTKTRAAFDAARSAIAQATGDAR